MMEPPRTLSMLSRHDSTWSADWSTTDVTDQGHLRKAFDMELSSVSENVMIVWGDNDNDIHFRFKPKGGSWTSAAEVLSTPVNTGKIEWVQLVPKPGTDDIYLTFSDSNRDLFGVLWNGTEWVSSTAYTLKPRYDKEAIAALTRLTKPFQETL